MRSVRMKVTGEYALFTRPEGKVERVSYPLPTPAAARGIFEAILWKPEFRYEIINVQVLKQPKFYSIVRNEVDTKAVVNNSTMVNPKDYFSDDHRQLRHSLLLKDVAYIIEARIILQPGAKDPIEKYYAMFQRRLEKGQCFHQPYLGTRECSAQFGIPSKEDVPIHWTDSLGPMFFDFRYPKENSITIPYFFNAEIKDGVMEVPAYLYEEVNR